MAESRSMLTLIRFKGEQWMVTPPDLSPAERRAHTMATVGGPSSLLVHAFYIFLFVYWGVWPLALFNVFSVIIWTLAILYSSRRRYSLALLLGYIEVCLHSLLVIIFIGWGFGAHYFLLTTTIGVAMVSVWPRRTNGALTIFSTLLFILFYYYNEFYPPLFTTPALQLAIMNILNISCAFGIIAAATIYVVSEIERVENANEALLNNVLPKSIAARLKHDGETIADDFQNASILFADLAGFTPLSGKFTPTQVVELLDTIFSRFDELVDQYGLEKIKTIGDEYMVASGIPNPRDDHAEALAHFALAMRDSLADFNSAAETDLQIRIGLNSGPVVAGVIGKSRFLYDLWGDSVNTASRMESHGVPGEIQVTEATKKLLDGRFAFTDRGMIEVKGKGPMRTYFLSRGPSA